MSRGIKITSKILPKIKNSGRTQERLDPVEVKAALGAAETGETISLGQSPLSLLALRQEILDRLETTGGRPGLKGTTRRQKIPLEEKDWQQLCTLAQTMQDEEIHPTPGQVASVLLRRALDAIDFSPLQTALKEELGQR